jgi:hypothetical protein
MVKQDESVQKDSKFIKSDSHRIKKPKKFYFISILLFIIIILITTTVYSKISSDTEQEELLNKIKSFQQCNLQLNTYINNMEFERAKVKIDICQEELNQIIAEINIFYIDNPNEENTALKLLCEGQSYGFSAVNIIIGYNINSYDINEIRIRQKQVLTLFEQYSEKLNKIKTKYSMTEVYKLSEDFIINEQISIDKIKNEIEQLLKTCPQGYYLDNNGYYLDNNGFCYEQEIFISSLA